MTDDIQKQYYKIKEVASIVGVPASTLRYWETEFPEVAPRRSRSNARYYTPKDIEKLKVIHYLVKLKGLKLEAAREQLRVASRHASREMQIIGRLEHIKSEMKSLLKAFAKRTQDEIFDLPASE